MRLRLPLSLRSALLACSVLFTTVASASAEITGHNAFFSIADAVIRENFMHGPAPRAAVDAMGDGVPYVHDVAEVSV